MSQYAIYPSLKEKRVLITGGAEGIGAATVSAFAHQGSQVIILDISESSATKLLATLKEESVPHLPAFYQCDVTDLSRLKEITTAVISQFGGVDVLVNNAASCAGTARAGTMTVTEEAWQFSVDVNLRHQFFLAQYLYPSMKNNSPSPLSATRGSIINMGSISWRIPATGMPVYVTCKAAIRGLTRTHAKEFGPDGIRVNSIMPGSIATERQIQEVLTEEYLKETMDAQAIKRVLKPEEVARTVLFLASEDSSGVTGSCYVVDGGWVGDA